MSIDSVCKMETEIEIKGSAEKFHEMFSCRPHHISNVTPHNIQAVDLHDGGEWGKPGTIISWNYMHDGVAEVAKVEIEDINHEKNSSTFKVIEGHLLDKYKNFHVTLEVSPKKEGGSLVHWIFQYEKISEDVSDPIGLTQLVIDMSKDMDAHLVDQA